MSNSHASVPVILRRPQRDRLEEQRPRVFRKSGYRFCDRNARKSKNLGYSSFEARFLRGSPRSHLQRQRRSRCAGM